MDCWYCTSLEYDFQVRGFYYAATVTVTFTAKLSVCCRTPEDGLFKFAYTAGFQQIQFYF